MEMSFVSTPVRTTDQLSDRLFGISRIILVVTLGFLPLIFIPDLVALNTTLKVYIVIAATALATIVASLGFLRAGRVAWHMPRLLVAWWSVVLATAIAGLLAPSLQVAFLGDSIEVHTVGFLFLLGVVMTLLTLFRHSKNSVIYLYGAWLISAFVLSTLHLLRIIFGPEWFSFGLLASPAATLVGTFNDLGLFLALVVIVGMIALLQLSLPKKLQILLTIIIAASILMLTVINFFALWIVLGLFSLLLLIYSLFRGRLGSVDVTHHTPSITVTI